LPTEVVAVQVVPYPAVIETGMKELFAETISHLHAIDNEIPLLDDPMQNLTLRTEFLGDGYAERTPECIEAVDLINATEGLHLETTYTGKGLAALVADARSGKLKGKQVAFWNTYNSRPYPKAVATVDTSGLPAELQRYLEPGGG